MRQSHFWRRPILGAAVVTLAFSAPATVWAQQGPGSHVLVMPFAAESDPKAPGGIGAARWLSEAAAVLVSQGLVGRGVGVVHRDDRVAVFDRLQLPMSFPLTRATTIRVGDLIGASEIVFGEIKLAQRLSVRARLVRLSTGERLPDIVDEAPLTEIFQLFERLSERVASATGRPLSSPLARAGTLSLEAFENYVKGLVAATPAAQQRFFETALIHAPRDPRILIALWDAYTAQGAHDKALAAANAVPAGSADSRRAKFAVALSMIELKRFDGAFSALNALHAERADPGISNALGVLQLRRAAPAQGATAPAVYFGRAADQDPANTDYVFNLGYAFALANNSQSALFWLREVVRYDAADGDAHLVMSAVLAGAGKTVEAQREFELARLLGTSAEITGTAPSPKVPPGLERTQDELEATVGRRADAVIANPAQRDQRETAAFHLTRGRRLFEEKKDREALDELRRAIYLAPYEDEPHLLAGRLYMRAGRLNEAIDEFKVAIWCRETAQARLALAEALLESGEKDAARREAERALKLDPQSSETRELLKKIGG
ncbi:MAG TPA: tetratricopeptide repeat protein [Vicinamibacterales bacterium]|nr:tetratricopeptide repeat protein [Vicinamibacterales bacterium]